MGADLPAGFMPAGFMAAGLAAGDIAVGLAADMGADTAEPRQGFLRHELKNMKNTLIIRHALVWATIGATVLLTGCVNPDGSPNNTGSGAIIGGAMGALTGAAIGGRGHAGPDALIGMAAGAVAGGLIGNAADREQEARLQAQAPRTYIVDAGPSRPTSVAEVKALVKAGVSDDIIISQIRNTRTIYHLTSTDVIGLRDAGVSDNVLNFMIRTPSLWAAR